jgi:hypothetical protein
MSTPVQLWGEIRQLGYVVPAAGFQRNIEHWAGTLGVGPWLVIEHPQVEDFVHRGVPGRLDFSIALAHAGAMQIELIAQHDDAPSTYHEFLVGTGGVGGLHHLAYWPADMDAAHAEAQRLGYEVWTSGRIGRDGTFRYYLTQDHPGTVVEHANITGARLAYFEELAARSRQFDPTRDSWYVTR